LSAFEYLRHHRDGSPGCCLSSFPGKQTSSLRSPFCEREFRFKSPGRSELGAKENRPRNSASCLSLALTPAARRCSKGYAPGAPSGQKGSGEENRTKRSSKEKGEATQNAFYRVSRVNKLTTDHKISQTTTLIMIDVQAIFWSGQPKAL